MYPVPCCCSFVGFVVAAVVPLLLVVGFVAPKCWASCFGVVRAFCNIQARKSALCPPRVLQSKM